MRPMQILRLSCAAGALLTLLGAHSAIAAVPPVFDEYDGQAHSRSVVDEENIPLDLIIDDEKPNGKFTAHLSGVPISGKITSAGKISFSGQLQEGALKQKVTEGHAQLSAGLDFIGGSFKVGGNLTPKANGVYDFVIRRADPLAASAVRADHLAAAAAPRSLGGAYAGKSHHTTNANLDEDDFFVHFDTPEGNGHFTGYVEFLVFQVPITGKVNAAGKVTFSGKGSFGGGTIQVKGGLAHLSAESTFLLGTFKTVGTGDFTVLNGNRFFESQQD